MGVSKNRGGPPKSSHFNRVFHEINHPFWGENPTIFGLTPIYGHDFNNATNVFYVYFMVDNCKTEHDHISFETAPIVKSCQAERLRNVRNAMARSGFDVSQSVSKIHS